MHMRPSDSYLKVTRYICRNVMFATRTHFDNFCSSLDVEAIVNVEDNRVYSNAYMSRNVNKEVINALITDVHNVINKYTPFVADFNYEYQF